MKYKNIYIFKNVYFPSNQTRKKNLTKFSMKKFSSKTFLHFFDEPNRPVDAPHFRERKRERILYQFKMKRTIYTKMPKSAINNFNYHQKRFIKEMKRSSIDSAKQDKVVFMHKLLLININGG